LAEPDDLMFSIEGGDDSALVTAATELANSTIRFLRAQIAASKLRKEQEG